VLGASSEQHGPGGACRMPRATSAPHRRICNRAIGTTSAAFLSEVRTFVLCGVVRGAWWCRGYRKMPSSCVSRCWPRRWSRRWCWARASSCRCAARLRARWCRATNLSSNELDGPGASALLELAVTLTTPVSMVATTPAPSPFPGLTDNTIPLAPLLLQLPTPSAPSTQSLW
jgi:hypothetical protein